MSAAFSPWRSTSNRAGRPAATWAGPSSAVIAANGAAPLATSCFRLIDEFGKRTGVPVIMNTSFNLRGEAIVHTPTDAIRTFFSSGMDALVLGSFLVEK